MNHPITKTLLALGCAGTLATTASAQLPTTYSPGDFILGFRQTGTNLNSVVVDIGPIASFSTPMIFAINLGTTLSSQYGSGFSSDSTVYASLAETDANDNTNYVTSPVYLTGLNVAPVNHFKGLTNTNSNILQNKINSLGEEFGSAGQVQPKTDPNAYANFMPGGSGDAGHANGNISFGFFNPDTEGNFGQTTAGVDLDLLKFVPGAGPGTDLGFFQVSGDGNTLTFTPAVVPEPSTYAAMAALGALAFLGFRRSKARQSSTQEQSA